MAACACGMGQDKGEGEVRKEKEEGGEISHPRCVPQSDLSVLCPC